MARDRSELQTLLETVLGSNHVYFQPPEGFQLRYPCIVYRLDSIDVRHADNRPYKTDKEYLAIVIDRNPDSTIPDRLLQLPLSRFSTHYTADNLHHWSIALYW